MQRSAMEYSYCLLALAIIALSLLYYYLTSEYGFWKRNGVPCPGDVVPGLGHLYPMILMKKHRNDMFLDLYNKMSNVSMMGFYDLREPALMIREPELIKTIMVNNFGHFSNNALTLDKDLDPLGAINPFFVDGERWKASRQQLSSAFSSGKLKYMFASVSDVCNQMRDFVVYLQKKGNGMVELELKDLFSRYTSGVVASAAFGVEGDAFKLDKDGPFREVGREMFEPSLKRGVVSLLVMFFPFVAKILRQGFVPGNVDRFFRKVVKDVLEHRAENGINRPDFLQLMIGYKEAVVKEPAFDQQFDDNVITSHAASFFFDGYETSSVTLTFAVYQIAAHPEIQRRLREEVNTVLEEHGSLTYDALKDMKYMDQVLNESMRLYPIGGALSKRCTDEIELVGSDGIAVKMNRGMIVYIPVVGLHRDPNFWTDPETFDPERFTPENIQNRHRFVFLPFGEGPRICIGMRMALMQMKAAMATILSNFSLELSPRTKTPIQMDTNHFLPAAVGGIWVNVRSL